MRKNRIDEIPRNYFKVVKKICNTLKIADISTFIHIRVSRESKFFVLSNNQKITKYCAREKTGLAEYLTGIINHIPTAKISVCLWPCERAVFLVSALSALKIGNGISIFMPFNDYVDIFSFAADIDNKQIGNFYLNYLKLLKRFIVYYRLKAAYIIDDMNYDHMIKLSRGVNFNNIQNSNLLSEIESFRQKMLPEKLIVKQNGKCEITLASKETKYLSLMLEGKSVRRIAEELGVSPKTVESVLQKTKWKTQCNTKIDLLSFLLRSSITSEVLLRKIRE